MVWRRFNRLDGNSQVFGTNLDLCDMGCNGILFREQL